ncbi:MAG: DUF2141 domain-containing protein [Parvularculaceae bacterium]|nr:DUF2141 domain-containing protein [Parvularculaceae bacterium]
MAAIAAASAGSALADSAPAPDPFAKFAADGSVVLAVQAPFAAQGGDVRLSVYDKPETFLEMAAIKHHGPVNDDGVALITLNGLEAGEYAFVAYFDANGDGKLNRSVLGVPTEPLIFSNDIKPKLRKPTFDETKVDVAPGAVVVLTMPD